MKTTNANTGLTVGQLHILEMMNRCKTEESLKQLKKVLFDFYVRETEQEAERLWNAGVISEGWLLGVWRYLRNVDEVASPRFSFCMS